MLYIIGDKMPEKKSEAVEILKEFFKELAKAYIKQLKMIEEYNQIKGLNKRK